MMVGLTLALAVVLAACGGDGGGDTGGGAPGGGDPVVDGGTPAAAGEQSTKLVASHPQEPSDWDFVRTGDASMRAVLVLNVLEPLLEGMGDGSFEPLLAESLEISDDGREYVFTLREATFHDGSELSADDVLYSLENNRTSPNGDIAVSFDAVETMEKIDDRTIRVTLSRPSQRFLAGMSGDSGLIYPEDTADEMSQGPIGTGPYVFGEWRPGVDVSLTRFDEYWGDQPYFEDVTWRFIPDETAALNGLLAGDTDVVSAVLGQGLDRLASIEETDGFAVTAAAGTEISFLSMNASLEMFDDERIRQAINHAIDREPILEGAFAGWGETTCVFVNPPTAPWNSDYCPYPYDPDRARELLAEAGAEDLTFEFKFLTVAEFPPIHEIVTAQLAAVGITAEPAARELATYFDEVGGEVPKYEFTSLSGPAPIDAWVCPGRFTLWCDPEFDELLARADAAVDPDEYADLRREAVERHADAGYLIPLVNKEEPSAHREDLLGIKPYRSASEFDMRRLRWAD